MINAIINASQKDRFMVLMAMVIISMVGLWSYNNTSLNAIPYLSDVQVIILTKYPGQAPQVVEDQASYPLTIAMLAVPYAKIVRGYSLLWCDKLHIRFPGKTTVKSVNRQSINFACSCQNQTVCEIGRALFITFDCLNDR